MAVPKAYANNYVPVKYMLSCYRALTDGRVGIRHLESLLANSRFLMSEWKIVWLGVCATLRSSIDLFQLDTRSCISPAIRNEIKSEWKCIKENRDEHLIFWEFLRKERDNVIHEYHWTAYEAWLDPEGALQTPPTILGSLLISDEVKPVLLMRSGLYEGRNSLELLEEAADWVEARIFAAIQRAGFDPDERRSAWDFHKMPTSEVGVADILGRYVAGKA